MKCGGKATIDCHFRLRLAGSGLSCLPCNLYNQVNVRHRRSVSNKIINSLYWDSQVSRFQQSHRTTIIMSSLIINTNGHHNGHNGVSSPRKKVISAEFIFICCIVLEVFVCSGPWNPRTSSDPQHGLQGDDAAGRGEQPRHGAGQAGQDRHRGQAGAHGQGVRRLQETVREVHQRERTLGDLGQHREAASECGEHQLKFVFFTYRVFL